jgi:MurNAc alpha-1-phosphate uridylyltransferase
MVEGQNKIRKALILAAGFGNRLRPLTEKTPKPLLTVQGITMLERAIRKLVEAGIEEIVVNTHYHAEQIHDFLKGYEAPNISLRYEYESDILDVGGGVKNVMAKYSPNEPMLVMNSDILLEGSLNPLINAWQKEKMHALLLLYKKQEGRGDFNLATNNKIIRQPATGGEFTWTGVSIMHPQLFHNYNSKKFHITDILFRASPEDYDSYLYFGLVHNKKWLDIGNLVNYEYACKSWIESNAT